MKRRRFVCQEEMKQALPVEVALEPEEVWEEAVVVVWEGWVELVLEQDPLANVSVQPVERERLIRQGSPAIL